MSTDLSIFNLILHASTVVQLVMLFLISISVLSWTIIFKKKSLLKQTINTSAAFEKIFWSGVDINDLHKKTMLKAHPPIGTEAIFKDGLQEYLRIIEDDPTAKKVALESAQRIMHVTMNREIETLENQLPMLATIGSNSPYVGLFGTVWGIMNAFHSLGNVKQATLAMVAPGIAEALIATAMGLFAAIPASIAYNDLTHQLQKLENNYQNFIEEFYGILQQ